MLGMEEIQKGIQQLVDLTKQDETTNPQVLKMPDLALAMAKYLNSLSKLCLTHYHSYSKPIKRSEKQKSQSSSKKKQGFDLSSYPPKKPLTAYIIYFQDRVPFFQQKYPKYTISQLTRLIAKQWKEVSQETKKPYLQKAAADRKRYQNDKQDFKLKKNLKKVDKQQRNRNMEQSDDISDLVDKAKLQNEQCEIQEQFSEGI